MGYLTSTLSTYRRRSWRWVAVLAAVATVSVGVAALASPVDRTPPRPVVLARADNPVDALSASSVAAAMGGIVLLTGTDALHPQARDGIREFDPDVVWLAGGEAALSGAVERQVADMGYRTLRVAGADRHETARRLGEQLAAYGVGRPLFTVGDSGQGVAGPSGDAALDGVLDAGGLLVDGSPAVSGLQTVTAEVLPYPNQGRAEGIAECPAGMVALSGSADAFIVLPRDDIALQVSGRPEFADEEMRVRRWMATWTYDPAAGEFPPGRVTAFCVDG